MNFSSEILIWYDKNKRNLPWRNIDNPYVIWIAEVVFQQTRIEQGLPYFLSFIKSFPSVTDLATALESDVLKKWQGLGYYSRARNLHFSANFIVNELNGVFPKTYKDLLLLKGVGPYIAAEVASVCYGEVVAAVDGNVQRVISRYFGIQEAINSTVGAKLINELANAHIDNLRPGDFNQALMDYGSSICSPKSPKCIDCTFNESCWAFRNGKQLELPVKLKKVKIRNRYFNYLLNVTEGKLAVHKRGEGDVWQGLFEPFLIETTNEVTEFNELEPNLSGYLLYSQKRILSHQRLFLSFWVTDTVTDSMREMEWKSLDELSHLPVSKSIEQLFCASEFRSLFNSVE